MTATMPRASEAQCVDTIIEAAQTTGWLAYHCRPAQTKSGRWSTALQGDPGFPDLVLCHPRHGLWFVEAKRRPNKVEPAQTRWLLTLGQHVRAAVVWVPEEMPALLKALTTGEWPD
jgi:hypothetical protein